MRKEKMRNMRKMSVILMSLIMVIVLAAGCGSSSKKESVTDSTETTTETQVTQAPTQALEPTVATTPTQTADSTKIMIAAAASLQYSLEEELIPMFEEKNPGITVEGTYDSSGKLQTQIESGIEADLFFSAATKQMDALNGEGLINSDSIVNLLKNKLVLIVPTDSSAGLTKFEDVAKADKIAIGDPASVPAGQYAQEALTTLGLWDKVSAKASLGTNVTEVLNWVSEGSADAGLVYATDAATIPDKVKVIAEAPSGSLKSDILYPVAILKNSTKQEAAQKFMDFLASDEAITVFEKYGFTSNK